MISDSTLYSLATFAGSSAVLLILLYHFLCVNNDAALAHEKQHDQSQGQDQDQSQKSQQQQQQKRKQK